MNAAYDIFKKNSQGSPVWIEAVRDLEAARHRVMQLTAKQPGDYLIFCHRTQELVSANRLTDKIAS